MTISLNSLIIGKEYDRPFLAKLWGYKDFHGISRGIVTPKNDNKIIIFITQIKQSCLTQYTDYYDPSTTLLFMDGEKNHKNDERLINSINYNAEIFLFYRLKHHSPFVYLGRIYLASYERNLENTPSAFVFSTNEFCAKAYNEICCEENTYGNSFSTFLPESEGKKKLKLHISYERSIKNRAQAIKIHGTTCSICGFNFNKFYGENLANDYIEIHHINPISKLEREVDPKTDLIPVCANCHRMLHRSRNATLSIDELKSLIINVK